MKQRILVIVGPTASGKSALAVELAQKFNGEIISADSRQVYRGLDIGTGKITKREMKGIPHHVLDVASPKKAFSANDFVVYSKDAIEQIKYRQKLPIICGGTGFYIDALLGRISLPDVPPNKKLRATLQTKTAAQLFALLKKKDLARAKALSTPSERNNKVRLIRALEIVAQLGHIPQRGSTLIYDTLWIGINPSQKELEKKIHTRLIARIKSGMIAEAKRLHANGLSYKRMEELGLEYRSLSRLLQNKITRKEFEEELFRDIRRYAKKQMMYWKRNAEIKWFDPKKKVLIEKTVRSWLAK
jgi:tRNA dimethylallyltransferase